MLFSHLLKTKSLSNDGRVLKWISGLEEAGHSSEVFVLEDNNQKQSSKLGNTKVTHTSLFFRKLFAKRKGYIFKIPEFSFKTIQYCNHSDASFLVFHDVQHYLTLLYLSLFSKKKHKIIWDLHELPHTQLSKFYITRKSLEIILKNVALIVYTNNARRDCVHSRYSFKENNYVILNNFPVHQYVQSEKAPLPIELEQWLNQKKYILWMGGAVEKRNIIPFLSCFSKWSNGIRLVIMGSISPVAQAYIEQNDISERIFSKYVSQDEIIKYVDNALFSVVFYNHTSENNIYCEPNRLYQLLVRKVPVIVGNNPPMKEVVEAMNAGIVLEDDGTNEKNLLHAMNNIYHQITQAKDVYYNENSNDIIKKMSWEAQFLLLLDKVKSIES